MNLEDCRRILQVPRDAGPDEVKTAFRKLAFRLHPDLNPAPDAADRFRELNEAYVLLSHSLRDAASSSRGTRQAGRTAAQNAGEADDARARKFRAGKAYARGAAEARRQAAGRDKTGAAFHFREEEVLRDLLSDPFARQVFEDIYSQLKNGPGPRPAAGPDPTTRFTAPSAPPRRPVRPPAPPQPLKRRRLTLTWGDRSLNLDLSRGLVGGIKSWLRGQLDDEETVSFPAYALGPGKILRLTLETRFAAPKTVEVTLPADFAIGRPVRLRGLGRKLGPFTGDLFLRVLAK